jgi:hypothetical protein
MGLGNTGPAPYAPLVAGVVDGFVACHLPADLLVGGVLVGVQHRRP